MGLDIPTLTRQTVTQHGLPRLTLRPWQASPTKDNPTGRAKLPRHASHTSTRPGLFNLCQSAKSVYQVLLSSLPQHPILELAPQLCPDESIELAN